MKSLFKKMRIDAPHTFRIVGLPEDKSVFKDMPIEGFTCIAEESNEISDSVHWFIKDLQQLNEMKSSVLKYTQAGTLLCCYFTKSTEELVNNLDLEKAWDNLTGAEIRRLFVVSVDRNWSAYVMRVKNESDYALENLIKIKDKTEALPIDTKIMLPLELENEFNQSPEWREKFQQLPYANRKEFIDWIKVARRDESRVERAKICVRALKDGKDSYHRNS